MTLVAQRYIQKPLLINGKKFDLRIYVLVTGVAPLRLFMFKDGLVRCATEDFKAPNASNLHDRCMHLTNYAVNKRSDNYMHNTDEERCDVGSKRSLRWFLRWLDSTRGPGCGDDLWNKMIDLCNKALLAALPALAHEYRLTFGRAAGAAGVGSSEGGGAGCCCFEVLGVDVMVDSTLKPWLVEFNHLPSFETDSPLDRGVKMALVGQTLQMVDASVSHEDRAKYQSAVMENSRMRLTERARKGAKGAAGDDAAATTDDTGLSASSFLVAASRSGPRAGSSSGPSSFSGPSGPSGPAGTGTGAAGSSPHLEGGGGPRGPRRPRMQQGDGRAPLPAKSRVRPAGGPGAGAVGGKAASAGLRSMSPSLDTDGPSVTSGSSAAAGSATGGATSSLMGPDVVLPGEEKLVDFVRIMPPVTTASTADEEAGRSSPTYAQLAEAVYDAHDANMKR